MKAPIPETGRRPLALPDIKALRELRRALSYGGLTPGARRSPEDHARITTFRVLSEMLFFLDNYRRRVEAGEALRLVEVDHQRTHGRLVIEFEARS
jgi:hypothetical protein